MRFVSKHTLLALFLAAAGFASVVSAQTDTTGVTDDSQPGGRERDSVRSGSLSISATKKTNPVTVKEESLPVISLDSSNVREVSRAAKQRITDGRRELPLTSPVPAKSLAELLTDPNAKTALIWRPAFATQGFRGARLDAFAVSQDKSVLAIAERTGIATGPNGTRIILVNTHNWEILRIFTTDYRLARIAFAQDVGILAAITIPQPELKKDLMFLGFKIDYPDCNLVIQEKLDQPEDATFQPENIALCALGTDFFCSGFNGSTVRDIHLPPPTTSRENYTVLEFETKGQVSAMDVAPDGSSIGLVSRQAIELFSVKDTDGLPDLSPHGPRKLELGWQPSDLKFLSGGTGTYIVCPSPADDSAPVLYRTSAKDVLEGRSAGYAIPFDGGSRVGVMYKVKGRIDIVNSETVEVEDSLILDQMKPQTNGTPLFVFYHDAINAFCVIDTLGNAFAVAKRTGEKRWTKRIIWNGAGKQ